VNYFVFVVCGNREYIDQLNFSLKYLKHFSKFPILVVSDLQRNEVNIEHDDIIDIHTPDSLNHHEASIFLETGLYKYLDIENNMYCYLDSDVVAVDYSINEVFDHFSAPITFAIDHSSIDLHSPHAMNCDCLFNQQEKEKAFSKIIKQLPILSKKQEAINDGKKLAAYFNTLKHQPIKHIFSIFRFLIHRYLLCSSRFSFNSFTFNYGDKTWLNTSGDIIDYDFKYYLKKLGENHGLYYSKINKRWENKDGTIAEPEMPQCNHLRKHVEKQYQLQVPPSYRHLNGGVFLFNGQSKEIMEFWHKITCAEMQKDNIRTKYIDQVTITAAAFKFNVSQNKTVPIKFNFICDYEHPGTHYSHEKGYTFNGFKTTFVPAFLHIYHHWSDQNWDIWQSVIHLGKKNGIIK
jgi:hypothetical protein